MIIKISSRKQCKPIIGKSIHDYCMGRQFKSSKLQNAQKYDLVSIKSIINNMNEA